MAAFVGINGAVTSWANNTQFITTGSEPIEFDINPDALEFDSTAFSALGISTFIKGLPSWSGQIRMRLKTAQTGDTGLVSYTAGFTSILKRWSMAVEVASHESTQFGDAARTFIPGKLSWGGDFDGYMDNNTSNPVTLPGNSNEPATGTFKLREAGATDDTLSGSIFTTRSGIQVSPDGVATVSYTYRGSGALTQSTPSAGTTVFPTGAVAIPTAGSLVLTAESGYTFTGSAFWTRVAIEMPVNELARVTLDFQGSGALAVSHT